MTIYLARDICGQSGKELGEYSGGISGAAITMRYNSVLKKLGKDKKLRSKINKIKNRIIKN